MTNQLAEGGISAPIQGFAMIELADITIAEIEAQRTLSRIFGGIAIT